MSKLSVLQKLLGKASSKAEMEAAEDILRMNPSLAKGESPELLKSLKQQELQSTFDKAAPRNPADLSAEVFERQGLPNFETVGKVRSEIPKSELNKVIDDPKGFDLQGKPYGNNLPVGEAPSMNLPTLRNSNQLSTQIPEAVEREVFEAAQPKDPLQIMSLQDKVDLLRGKKPQMTPIKEELKSFDNTPPGPLSEIYRTDDRLSHGGSIINEASGLPGLKRLGVLGTAGVLGSSALLNSDTQNKLQGPGEQSQVSKDLMSKLGLGQFNDERKFGPQDLLMDQQPIPPSEESEQPPVEKDTSEVDALNARIAELEAAANDSEDKKQINSEAQELATLLASEDNRESFADVLKHKNLSVLANQLGQAGNIIGGALAKTGPNEAAQKLFQSNVALAQQGPEDFKQQIAMDEHDPDSAVSKNYRAFLEKRGLKVGPGITAAQIKGTLLPTHEKEQALKTKLEASKSAAIDKKAERELRNKEIDSFKKERIDQTAQNLAKRQLESAKSRALSTIGGVAGNALRNRVVAANAMFGTVGVKEDITEQEVDKLKDVDLNKLPPQFIAELTVETNRMLTGSGIPAQSTFQKLMPKNLKMSEANIKNWVTSEMGPANQAAFAKLVLKTATRVKRNSQKSLSGLVKKSFSGTDHIKRQLPEDYENVIKELELNPEDFGFKPTPMNNVGIEEIERLDKKSGKTAIFNAKTKEFIRYK